MTNLSDDSKVVTVAFPAPEASPVIAQRASVAAVSASSAVADLDESVAGTDAQSAIELRLESFIGFNADAYLDYYQNVYQEKNGGPLGHWHWVPFLFSIPWLFLRRRYLTGIALAMVPLALHLAFPGGPAILAGLGAIALGCGLAGRPLYLALALRKIEQVEARRLWPVQRDEQLHRSGGVSLIGGACGAIVWACVATAPYLAALAL